MSALFHILVAMSNEQRRRQLNPKTLAISTMMVLKTEDMVTRPSTDLHTAGEPSRTAMQKVICSAF